MDTNVKFDLNFVPIFELKHQILLYPGLRHLKRSGFPDKPPLQAGCRDGLESDGAVLSVRSIKLLETPASEK